MKKPVLVLVPVLLVLGMLAVWENVDYDRRLRLFNIAIDAVQGPKLTRPVLLNAD